MIRFRKHLPLIAVLGVLAIVVTVMNVRSSVVHADTPPPAGPVVTISPSQLPLAVQGSIGLTGTPNVNVTNLNSNPVPVRNVGEADQPVTLWSASVNVPNGAETVDSGPAFTVPTGKRLIMEYISGTCGLLTGQTVQAEVYYPMLGSNIPDGTGHAFLPYSQPVLVPLSAGTQGIGLTGFGGPIRAYAEPGNINIRFNVSPVFNSTVTSGNCEAFITGHLINTQ